MHRVVRLEEKNNQKIKKKLRDDKDRRRQRVAMVPRAGRLVAVLALTDTSQTRPKTLVGQRIYGGQPCSQQMRGGALSEHGGWAGWGRVPLPARTEPDPDVWNDIMDDPGRSCRSYASVQLSFLESYDGVCSQVSRVWYFCLNGLLLGDT